MKRLIEEKIVNWVKKSDKALLISGARQVGKTYSIRKVLNELNINYYEINFVFNTKLKELIEKAETKEEIIDIFLRNSDKPLIKGSSIIFFDEIQEFSELITKIKFLVDEGSFKYILSGSLLGIELFSIRSLPVGYLEEIKMYPMNLYEFSLALGINGETWNYLKKCYNEKLTIDEITHNKMLNVFYSYLISGGMPDVVKNFIDSKNIRVADEVQKNIVNLYKGDFSKYENKDRKLKIIEIYDNIPTQLNKQNLKFVFTYLNKELKFDRYENSFLWLKDAGVAIPTFNVSEVKAPLFIFKEKNSFKLFMNDVGLLLSYYSTGIKESIYERNENNLLNLGGLFKNFVSSELKSLNFDTYYFKNTKIGEVNFLIEQNSKIIAIEVKSGKDFKKHNSLDKLKCSSYQDHISNYFVLSTNNLFFENDILYLPIYMIYFLKEESRDYIVNLDF